MELGWGKLVLATLFFGTVWSLECSKNRDCKSVSKNDKYVMCLNNTCQCLTWNGFSGNASKNSKCYCPKKASHIIVYQKTIYCVKKGKTTILYRFSIRQTQTLFLFYRCTIVVKF